MKLERHAVSIALVALAAIAAVVVFVVDRDAVTTRESTLRKKNLFEIWRVDDISRVAIQNGARSALLTRGTPNDAGQRGWRITIDGAEHAAEEQAVDQLFGTLEFAIFERKVEGMDRAALGLDAPARSFAIDMGRQHLELAIGGPAPSPEGASYASVAGRGVFVVTKQLVAALDVDPDTLRSRSFVPYFSDDLRAFWLDGEEGGARHLERVADGNRFRFDGSGPEGKVRANRIAVERVFTAFGDMQATAFPTEAQVAGAFEKAVTITLVPRDSSKPKGIVEIGGACPDRPDDVLAVRRAPTPLAVCVPASVTDALEADADAFVDHRLVQAPIDEVTDVKLVAGDKAIEVGRSGSGWHERIPDDVQLEAEVGRALVAGVLDLEGTLADEKLEPADVRATVRVVSVPARHAPNAPAVERIEELAIGAPKDGRVLVERKDDGQVLAVDATAADALLPKPLALRARRVLDVKESAVKALHVVGGGRDQRLERTATGGWTLAAPAGDGLEPDIGLAADVVHAVTTLSAARWVAEEDDGTHGLGTPRATVELDVEATGDAGPYEKKIAVEIGAATADGSFARIAGDKAVFVAPKTLEAAADRWLLARSALAFDVTSAKRVVLSVEGTKLEVVQSTAGWAVTGGGPESAATAAAVRDALEDLMAEGAASVGPAAKAQGFDKPSLEVRVERADEPVHLVFGATDSFRGVNVVYARRDGIDATYALAAAKVRPLLEAVGTKPRD